MATGDLITLAEYLTATDTNPADLDTADNAQINWQIAAVSDTIRAYTDRDFTLNTDANQAPRTYRFQGQWEMDIDDATEVTQVELGATPASQGRTLDATEWYASAVGNPDGILDTLELYTRLPNGMSPEMGFKNNLDRIGYIPYPVMLVVTATWGWPAIPPKVKQAAVLAIVDFTTDQDEYNSESIASYSHSRTSSRSGIIGQIQALPAKAIALLDAYTRLNI